MNENRDQLEEYVAELDSDIDVMADEIIRLQERIRALEKPSSAFGAQLLFDVFMVLVVVFLASVWYWR